MLGSSSANHTISSEDGDNPIEAHDSRMLLELYGDTFTNQSKAAATIKSIFHERFCGPYTSWKKVPPHVKEIWWVEFKRQQKGDSYEYHELWNSLHIMHKDGPNKGQFIDQKAKKTRDKFDEILHYNIQNFHQVHLAM